MVAPGKFRGLEVAGQPEDMNIAGFRFHGLQGKPKRWSVRVTGNYRITFGWLGDSALDVDFEHYLKVARLFGGSPEVWMRLQAAYDLKKSEQNKKVMARVARIVPVKMAEEVRA